MYFLEYLVRSVHTLSIMRTGILEQLTQQESNFDLANCFVLILFRLSYRLRYDTHQTLAHSIIREASSDHYSVAMIIHQQLAINSCVLVVRPQ